MTLFHRSRPSDEPAPDETLTPPPPAVTPSEKTPAPRTHTLPFHHQIRQIHPDGESGRRGVHPLHFLKICWRSSSPVSQWVNVLWPAVPAAIAVRYARPDWHLAIFILCYIAMVPCANLVGFAGQELARKLPKVFGILLETTLGSVVELVLFIVLVKKDEYEVIQAAILGSVLATLLLCLGLCFFVGGLTRHDQHFDEAVSEVGSGLLLTAGLGLAVPTVFETALTGSSRVSADQLSNDVLYISRVTSILLIIAYAIYVFFQMQSHHSIYDALLEKDEERDEDREEDLSKPKLTFTEACFALAVAVALVAIIAVALVDEISYINREQNVPDAFLGLILVPLVEKAAEHLTAVDEAYDNQMNFALSHVLGATIQTALFNGPLIIIIAWGLHKPMDLTFEVFNIVVLILAVLVVGNFLRDQKSNYLEGALCVIVYIIIAVAAFYYPDPSEGAENAGEEQVVTVVRAIARF